MPGTLKDSSCRRNNLSEDKGQVILVGIELQQSGAFKYQGGKFEIEATHYNRVAFSSGFMEASLRLVAVSSPDLEEARW